LIRRPHRGCLLSPGLNGSPLRWTRSYYVTFCNLANLNAAMRGILLDVLKVKLMCVGQGPTLDYADASAFLAELHQPIFDLWKKRHLH
jgi:hypothetical protein